MTAAWGRLSRKVQRAAFAAVLAVLAIWGGLKATSWAENSLGRPRYEVVWEAELPQAERAYVTLTSDRQYIVLLHTTPLKRAYKLSPRGEIVWSLDFAKQPRTGTGGVYNEMLGLWGVIPTSDGGAMTYGGLHRVFLNPEHKIDYSSYVARIAGDGTLSWQKEFLPGSGWQMGTSFGLSPAVPYASGGLFFSRARRAREPSAGRDNRLPNFDVAWWLQLDADGKVVAEHFDLEAERAGYSTSVLSEK